jgi:hypothetical protein
MTWRSISLTIVLSGLLTLGPLPAGAQAAPASVSLGAAAAFGVLGGSTVTSAGVSTVMISG